MRDDRTMTDRQDRPAPRHRPGLAPLATLALLAACSGGGGGSEKSVPPALAIEGLNSVPDLDSALVTWTTTRPSEAIVEWGGDATYGHVVTLAGFAKAHSVELTGLAPESTYHYRVLARGEGGDEVWSSDRTIVTLPEGAFVSDDFDRHNLDLGVWTLVDPLGDAELALVGAGTGDAWLELGVPGDASHNAWTTNDAARVVQPVGGGDFVLEAKFLGGIAAKSAGHGLLVEQAPGDWLRFDVSYTGSKILGFAAAFAGGGLVEQDSFTLQSGVWPEGSPMWLRVTRVADTFAGTWSIDGTQWNPGFAFTLALEPELVGLQAINHGGTGNDHTLRADTFFDVLVATPADDAGAPNDVDAPYLYRAEASAGSDSRVAVEWATDEPTFATVRWGLNADYLGGIFEATVDAYADSLVVDGLDPETTYHFRIDTRDAAGNETTGEDLIATTLGVGESASPEIALWSGAAEGPDVWRVPVGGLGNAQAQFNLLGNVTDGDEARLVETVSMYYRLNGGTWKSLALGDDRDYSYAPWRLVNEGDFNVELYVDQLDDVPAVAGVHANVVELEALDDDGNQTILTVHVDYTGGVTWNPVTQVAWADVLDFQGGDLATACQIVDGEWYVHDDAVLGPVLRQRSHALGYDRLVAVGEGHGPDAWSDYEVETTATVVALDPEGFTPGTSSYAFGFGLRWTGHTSGWTYSQPNHNIYPLGGLFMYRWYPGYETWQVWTNKDEAVDDLPAGNPVALGATYRFRLRCETQPLGGTLYALKMWPDGEAEPAEWTYEVVTPVEDDPQTGSFLFVAHHVDVLLGDLTVTPLD